MPAICFLVHRSQNNWTNAQNVFLRVRFKKRRRSGLRRGFLNLAIGKTGKYSVQLFKIRCTSSVEYPTAPPVSPDNTVPEVP